ncbi:hypothetical protein AMTRI_Chr07g23620 [Amborella trichopoda]
MPNVSLLFLEQNFSSLITSFLINSSTSPPCLSFSLSLSTSISHVCLFLSLFLPFYKTSPYHLFTYGFSKSLSSTVSHSLWFVSLILSVEYVHIIPFSLSFLSTLFPSNLGMLH